MSILLTKAIILATAAHQGQLDKCGHPYILHPIRVMCMGQNLDEQLVGVLHDTVEDTDITLHEIGNTFGEVIKVAINAITHRPNEPRLEYLARVKKNELATIVKLHDLTDNTNPERMAELMMRDPEAGQRMRRKYIEAYNFFYGKEPEDA